jgi:GNAT superfamily N-acetyltransferase
MRHGSKLAPLLHCGVVHPLADLITGAAAGRFPAPDGGWRRVPPWRPGLEASFAFTGHSVFAVAPDVTDERLAALGADGFGGAQDPRLITALAGPGGWIDCLDMVLAGRGSGQPGQPPRLTGRPDLAAHPRAVFAAQTRDQARPLGYPGRRRSALAVISRGIAGLTELSFELEPGRRGRGGGTQLVRDALTTVPSGQLVLAAVAPGNAASVRALLAAGFVPLGSVQLFRRASFHDPEDFSVL